MIYNVLTQKKEEKMNITENQYQQLHDYISQIISLSGRNGLPTINQTVVAKRLDVDNSGISRFLNYETKKPKKLLSNLKASYPLEFEQWPTGATTIGRTLQKIDALYLLGQHPRPSQIQRQSPPVQPNGRNIIPITPMPPQNPPTQPVFNRRNIIPTAPHVTKEILTGLAPRFLFPTATTETHLLPTKPTPAGFNFPPLVRPPAPQQAPMMPLVLAPAPQPPRRGPVIVQIDLPNAPMAISYRGHQSNKDAEGMLFDHMRFQTVTQFSSYTLVPENQNARTASIDNFTVILRGHVAKLPFGVAGNDLVKVPQTVQSCADLGLLIIPGRARANEDEPIRLNHEYKVIRSALNRGQPMLAICAGSWRLWEQLIIWTGDPNALTQTCSTFC